MKKLLLIAFTVLQAGAFAQAITNGQFENWTSYPYNDANGWNSGNQRDIQRMGTASVTKVTGFSGFGIRIQTNVVGSDTSDSYIINTASPCSDPPQWTGGVPYSQQPTAITGYYRYNLLGSDTAILIVIFRKNGLHIGDNIIKIRGTGSQSAFTPFSFTVACSGVPDTLIIAAAASNKTGSTPSHNGSFIELDNLAFSGASQVIPNGNFENWTAYSYDVPTGWASFGNTTKTTSSYAGSYAIRMQTTNDMCGGNINPSGITNGYMSSNNGPKGGKPYTNQVDTLCGYYKYTPVGTDSASVFINLSKNGSPVGGMMKQLSASANYVFFQMPFNAFTIPDTIRIDVNSSKWSASASNLGSVLYVDNLYLKSASVGIFENNPVLSGVYAYPNPAGEVFYIRSGKQFSPQVISIYDALGKVVLSQTLNSESYEVKMNIKELPVGLYYYKIKTSDGIFVSNRFVKQ